MAISTGFTPLNTPPGIKREVRPVPITKGVTLYDGRVRRIKTVEFVRKPDGSYDMPDIEFEIFLSDDGGKLLKMVEENKAWIQTVPNRVQIFIETDNDVFSKKVMKIIAGRPDYVTTDFDLRNVFDTFVPYSQQDIDSLLYSLFQEKETFRERFFNLFSKAVSGAASLTATMFDMVIHGIESLRISDKWWQIHAKRLDEKEKGYTAKDFMELMDKSIETLLGKISGIDGFLGKRIKKYLGSIQLAFQEVPKVIAGFQASVRKVLGTTSGMLIGQHFVRLCGLWNGIVDMVAGLVFIVKALVSGVKGVKDAAEAAAGYRKRIVEELDNIAKMFRSIQWAEVFDTLVEQVQQLPSLSTVVSAVWTKTTGALGKGWDWLAGMSYLEFCYYEGYIASFFIPFGYIATVIGKIPKIGQPLAKAFNFVNDIMEKAFGFVMQKGQPIMKKFADIFTHIKNMLSKGTGEVKSVLKNIFEKLKELLDNLVERTQASLLESTDTLIGYITGVKNISREMKKLGVTVARNVMDSFDLFYQGKLLRTGTKEELSDVLNNIYGKSQAKVRVYLDDLMEGLDWMATNRIGSLGGKILKDGSIRKLRGFLKTKGITLLHESDPRSIYKLFKEVGGFKSADELFSFMNSSNPKRVGMFSAETKQFILLKDATEIIAFHEQQHFIHMMEVGEITYKGLSKLEKETYVWNKIYSKRKNWSNEELQDALNYINRVRVKEYNLTPLKVKI